MSVPGSTPSIIFEGFCKRDIIFTLIMRVNKNIKIFFNYFLGPILFVWLAWSVYRQVIKQEDLSLSWQKIQQSFTTPLVWNLAAVIFLMMINWSLEAVKWRILVRGIEKIKFFTALKAVFSGVSFSVTMPNRIGEYLGRVLYMHEGNRLRSVSLTVFGSISQLIITLAAGMPGLIFLREKITASGIAVYGSPVWIDALIYGTAAVLIFLMVIYCRISWFVRWLSKFAAAEKYSWLFHGLGLLNASVLLQLLSLSAIRFFVFALQYYLLFDFFDVTIGWWQSFWVMSVLFLVLTIIPGFALVDFGMRGNVGLLLAGLFSANKLGITFAVTAVWFINLAVPALIGSIMIIGIKIFSGRNEKG